MISVINYKLGNLGSIINMLHYLNIPAQIVDKPELLKDATHIILPGVGAFDSGMEQLQAMGWIPVLEEKVLLEKIPFLGICLGMQLMTNSSEEGTQKGLGWIDGHSTRLKVPEGGKYRIPHMGWADVKECTGGVFRSTLLPDSRFYFAHSYTVRLSQPGQLWLSAHYGIEFCAAFRKGNILGVQFHPEKSHKYGLDFFRKFYSDFPQ